MEILGGQSRRVRVEWSAMECGLATPTRRSQLESSLTFSARGIEACLSKTMVKKSQRIWLPKDKQLSAEA